MSELFVLYWALYWLMNGLDKFVNRTDLGLFTWHGKDRMDQFGGYFSNCGLSEQWITPLLYVVGLWEFLIFAILAVVLWARFVRSCFAIEWFKLGMCLGGLTFVIFSRKAGQNIHGG